jgi:hypothetical protein
MARLHARARCGATLAFTRLPIPSRTNVLAAEPDRKTTQKRVMWMAKSGVRASDNVVQAVANVVQAVARAVHEVVIAMGGSDNAVRGAANASQDIATPRSAPICARPRARDALKMPRALQTPSISLWKPARTGYFRCLTSRLFSLQMNSISSSSSPSRQFTRTVHGRV